jgi:hypothetical protein
MFSQEHTALEIMTYYFGILTLMGKVPYCRFLTGLIFVLKYNRFLPYNNKPRHKTRGLTSGANNWRIHAPFFLFTQGFGLLKCLVLKSGLTNGFVGRFLLLLF